MKKLLVLILVLLSISVNGLAQFLSNLDPLLIMVSVGQDEAIIREQLTGAVVAEYKAGSSEYRELSKIVKKAENKIKETFPNVRSQVAYMKVVYPD